MCRKERHPTTLALMAYLPDSADDLAALIERAVEAAVDRAVPPAVRQGTRRPYMTKAELMELTGWSSRTVEYRKSRREIPYVRQGRTVLFPTDEIEAYLREGYVPATVS